MIYTNLLFGPVHIIQIVVSIGLIVLLAILSKKISFQKCCKILLYVGIVSEIVKIFYYIIRNEATHGGYLPKTDLPFHLCSIQIIFILIVNIVSSEKIKRFILSFMLPSCLIGGIAAILIATDSARNSPIITVQYYLYHIAIVVFAIKIYTNKEFKLNINDYFNCLKFILAIMFFAIYINSIVFNQGMLDGTQSEVNFMYVVSPPQKGLPFLNEDHGWFVYICHYACLVLFAIRGCYFKTILDHFKNKKQENLVN